MNARPNLGEVRRLREATLDNGFSLVRVKARGKAPVGFDWQNGESRETLLRVTEAASNTGMICRGLRVIDVDVDDIARVRTITKLVAEHLPKGPLIRCRPGSPRLALVYRAIDGEPGKRAISGDSGKIEVLGAGQQCVIDGIHPSGFSLTWYRGRSPEVIRADTLSAVSEEQIGVFLQACEVIVGVPATVTRSGNFLNQSISSVFAGQPFDSALSAGISDGYWFQELTPHRMKALVAACLASIDNRQSDPRERWLSIVFAVADAGTRGCPDARELALTWSQQGAGWHSEDDFGAAWNSFRPGRVTVGTLVHHAKQAGADLSSWQSSDPAPALASVNQLVQSPLRRALAISELPSLPAKRKWLHGTDLIRGAVTLMVAPGGRGKSSWLLALAIACASGKEFLGSHVFGGPLRVLYINAEDATNEIVLRLRAAMAHHGLTDAEVSRLHIAGVDQISLTLLQLDHNQPKLHADGWNALNTEIDRLRPDIVIIDPLVAVVGGVTLNDNSAIALLMRNFARIAATQNLGVVLAHHAAKNREASSAEAAMGAASLVNLARICVAIEPLNEGDAIKVGVPPWEAYSIFRVIGTKQNLSPPNTNDRWFRLVSVEMPNAEPPVYPHGDLVGVVEKFTPNMMGSVFPAAVITAALGAIANANPPLSPSGRGAGTCAVPVIAAAIAPHRGGKISDAEGKAVLDYLTRNGMVTVITVKVPRQGRGAYERRGLGVTGIGAPPAIA